VSVRNIIAALGVLAVAGVIALVVTLYSANQNNVDAQMQPVANPPRPAAPASSGAAPVAPAAGPSVRTETITYDAWTVACRYGADGKTGKVCSATLPLVAQQQNQRVNLGAWILAHNTDGALLSVVQTPEVDIGVLIAKGVALKLGNGQPHTINYVVCNPQRCEATLPMDDALIRESVAAANGPAMITFWKADGAEFNINIQSIKGIERALAAMR
jgi:invasion protein IalB